MGLGKYNGWIVIAILAIVLIIISIFVTTLGPADIGFFQAGRIMLSGIPLIGGLAGEADWPSTYETIIFRIRMPRIILGMLVGAGLAVSGAAFQGLFKNPMADPYIIGISSGASLGATVAIVFSLTFTVGIRIFSYNIFDITAISIMAFLGALLTVYVVYNLARVGGKIPVATLLLSGIAVGSFLSALVSFMMVVSRENLHEIVFWIMGSLSNKSWDHVRMAVFWIVTGSSVLLVFARDLNVMLLGEEKAQYLGINVEIVKKILLVAASLVVASAVSVSGIIGFVGLIIPHTVRLIVGPDHKILLPASAIFGSIFLIICDTIARTAIAPTEIPVGIVTSLFGGPFFIYLLRKRRKDVFF